MVQATLWIPLSTHPQTWRESNGSKPTPNSGTKSSAGDSTHRPMWHFQASIIIMFTMHRSHALHCIVLGTSSGSWLPRLQVFGRLMMAVALKVRQEQSARSTPALADMLSSFLRSHLSPVPSPPRDLSCTCRSRLSSWRCVGRDGEPQKLRQRNVSKALMA